MSCVRSRGPASPRNVIAKRLPATTLLALTGILLMAAMSGPALGHRPGKWYGARWDENVVRWHFDDDFPRGDGVRRAVLKGSRQWNRAGAELRFRRARDREGGRIDPCSHRHGQNLLHWKRIDGPGGILALTVSCTFGDARGRREMHSFEMMFDRAEPWHTDPSSHPAPFQTDLWAVASHEFGHAGGRITGGPDGDGHFPEDSRYCPNLLDPRRHTMCPSYDLIAADMRTLEKHDVDVFRRAYGRR